MKFNTPKQIRLLRAQRICQELRTLQREGVLYTTHPMSCVTLAEYMVKFRKELALRINQKTSHKPHLYRNAERAADIILNGEKSVWWFARHSTSHSGADVRGIVHHVNKFKKKIKKNAVLTAPHA